MRNISQYIFLNTLDCHYRGWLLRREEAKAPLSCATGSAWTRVSGIVSLSPIPDEFSLTALQEKVRECLKAGALITGKGRQADYS